MNQYVTGAVIKRLREEKNMTQQQLADKLSVSAKKISKWETAKGYPDITLLESIANALSVSVTELISGNTIVNSNVSANMLRSHFYVCPVCGNIVHSMGETVIQGDGEQAESHDMPADKKENEPEQYEEISADNFMEYSKSMFSYWTENDFASSFRKMLTLEQFRNEEMQALYQQYLVSGPAGYVKDLFKSMGVVEADKKATMFYSIMFFYYRY